MYIKKGKYGGDKKKWKIWSLQILQKNENLVVTKFIEKRKYGRDKIYRKTKIWS